MNSLDDFIKASLEAIKELYHIVEESSADKDLYKKYSIGHGGDISYGIDLIAESIYIKHLSSFGKIYSEESGMVGVGDGVITLDPLDGSANFLSNIPYYGSSIAYELDDRMIVGIVVNLANGDIFLKTIGQNAQYGNLKTLKFHEIKPNISSQVGLFEKAYQSKICAKKLHDKKIKYRSLGAMALSIAYSYSSKFFIVEGKLRIFDIKAALFICEDLPTYRSDDLLIISHDRDYFDELEWALLS
jgi:myo-inositol-1(or 4)-monophosphatase